MVALAVVIGTVGRRRSTAARSTETEKHVALVTYLHEHLSGSDIAMRVVERLRRTQTEERQLFDWLYRELETDRDVVRTLLRTLGESPQSPKRLLGKATGSMLTLVAGGARGDLSLFRTLEALAIAVQGKRCLWRALQQLRPTLPLPGGQTFTGLESSAVRQWDAIERRRATAAPHTFAAPDGELLRRSARHDEP